MIFSTRKNMLLDIEKPDITTWLFCIYFHFSVIFFHVYICKSYATLDTDEKQKSGLFVHTRLLMQFARKNLISMILDIQLKIPVASKAH